MVDPVRALEKLARLVAPEGSIILTAPFNYLTRAYQIVRTKRRLA